MFLDILNKPNSLSFFRKKIKDLGNTFIDTDKDIQLKLKMI